jgi:hypothetical protein
MTARVLNSTNPCMEIILSMNKLKSLNMCDFCSREQETCGAKTLLAKELNTDALSDLKSVVACDIYESPVEVLKKKFH